GAPLTYPPGRGAAAPATATSTGPAAATATGAAGAASTLRMRAISPLSSLSCICSSSVCRSRLRIFSASEADCAEALAGISSHAPTSALQAIKVCLKDMDTSSREFAAPGTKLADEDDHARRLLRVDDAPLNLLQSSPRVAWQHQFRARERE